MFAVPGWAVSAETLMSTSSNEVPSASSPAGNALLNSTSKLRKRRRDEPGLSESRVTGEDLHKLWNKEFGDGSSLKQRLPKARKKKRQQKGIDANSRPGHHATLEVKTEDGDKFGQKAHLDSREIRDRHDEQRGEIKSKRKPRDNTAVRRSIVVMTEKLEKDGKADLPHNTQHGRVEARSEVSLQNQKAQQALEKLRDLSPPSSGKLTPLQAKMRDKLTSARFRHLNETLYTSPSSASLDLFTISPDLFAEYHAGFAQQVKDSWPENPVDGYIRDIKTRAKVAYVTGKHDSTVNILSLPRRKTGSCTIADLGCGDAPLARACQSSSKALNLKFHNFDLHAPNPLVTKADIANVPLRDGEADIAVFCLSLMGTNWINFIEEGWRVLRGDGKGELWVAEVKSRFGHVGKGKIVENSVGRKRKPENSKAKRQNGASIGEEETDALAYGEDSMAQDETDVSAFTNVVQRRGFALQTESLNKGNRMFVSMVFFKTGIPSAGKYQGLKWNGQEYEKSSGSRGGRKRFIDKENDDDEDVAAREEAKVLKPCVYKKR
jgi:ribosomal RNA-processing protein 8